MAKFKIPGGSGPFNASGADTTYHLAAGTTIESATVGINADGVALGRVVQIDGSIAADHVGVALGDAMVAAPKLEVAVGAKGEIDGSDAGIVSYGLGHTILNAGTIIGTDGIDAHGAIKLTNTGNIYGFYAVNIFSAEGGSSVIRNSGSIIADHSGKAIYSSEQVEKVINTGTIHGEVVLGGGNDIFIFKSGTVDGEVRGGYDDDLYVVRKSGLDIVEEYDQGNDSVRSSVTFTLSSNVEDLTLTGRKNIYGIGNGGDNDLVGNSGDNRLSGWYGDDYIDGGKGHDKLTGGFGSDVFHFQRGGGKDVVTDFDAGFDTLDLTPLKGVKDFDDMIKHHVDDRHGDLWISYGDDTVVLRHTEVGVLDASNFILDGNV